MAEHLRKLEREPNGPYHDKQGRARAVAVLAAVTGLFGLLAAALLLVAGRVDADDYLRVFLCGWAAAVVVSLGCLGGKHGR